MSHIFISYAFEDLTLANKIVDALEKDSVEAWINWKSIHKGEDWEQEIYRAIEEADAFLFLISPDSIISQMCNREIAHAVKNGKRILPIVVREIETTRIPGEVSKYQWILCRKEQDDFDRAIEDIRVTIRTDYEWYKHHTKLQNKALDWEANNNEPGFLLHGKELIDFEKFITANLGKEPAPTELQTNYVGESRAAENRQRVERDKTSRRLQILGVVLTGMAILAIWFGRQAGTSKSAEQLANELATIAQGEAAEQAATAQFEATRRAEAEASTEEQARIALAQKLASQAWVINKSFNSKQMLATLLTIQSMRISPTGDAASFLINENRSISPLHRLSNGGDFATFSFDEKFIISGGSYVNLWEISSGREVATIIHDGHGARVFSLSPNGNFGVTGGDDGVIHVWEITSGKEVSRMTHEGRWHASVTSIAFHPDGDRIVSGSADGTVRVWEMLSGIEVTRMSHDMEVTSVAFSPGGLYVLSGSRDGTARVWDTASGMEVSRRTHENSITAIAFLSDGELVISGSADGTARVWEAATGVEVSRMTHLGGVKSIAISPDGHTIASGGRDGIVRIWEAGSGKEIARMTHDDTVNSIAFHPNGEYIISGSSDGTARVWQIAGGNEIARVTHDENVSTVAFSRNGDLIVSGGVFTLYVWKTSRAGEVARTTYDLYASAATFSPDGNYVISCGCEELDNEEDRYCSKGTVRMWESISSVEVARLVYGDRMLTSVSISPDGKYITTSDDTISQVWDVINGTRTEYPAQKRGNDDTLSVAASPDGKYVVWGGRDGSVRVWSSGTGSEVVRMVHQGGVFAGVNSVSFSPDGQFVASGSDDGTARIWELASGKEVARMTHDGSVSVIAFSSTGKYVISGSDDGTARVWELSSGSEIARMVHENKVVTVAFSPNGKYVLSGSEDGTVRVWKWMPADLIVNACSGMMRNLTLEEWQQYIGDALPYQAVCPNLPVEPEIIITQTP